MMFYVKIGIAKKSYTNCDYLMLNIFDTHSLDTLLNFFEHRQKMFDNVLKFPNWNDWEIFVRSSWELQPIEKSKIVTRKCFETMRASC